MNTELIGIMATFAITVALAIPFGKYIGKVYAGDRTLLDPIFNPLEKLFFKVSSIDATQEMNWK
jgi:potassium-transporting ATPase potassium-binding subunit